MRIYLKTSRVKFHPDPIWNDGALGFLKSVASKQQQQQQQQQQQETRKNYKKNNTKVRSNMRSVPGPKI